VVLWLPDTTSAAYRARIAEQCARLGRLTPDEQAMAAAFEGATDITDWH
jgi:hypothetical protein